MFRLLSKSTLLPSDRHSTTSDVKRGVGVKVTLGPFMMSWNNSVDIEMMLLCSDQMIACDTEPQWQQLESLEGSEWHLEL